MTDAVANSGYASVAVEDVLHHSGASRSTFYEQFTGKDDCFLAAQEEISGRLIRNIELEVRAQEPQLAHQSAIRVLVGFATDDPSAARLLFLETLAADHRSHDAREKLIGEIEQIIEKAWMSAPSDAPLLDICAWTLISGVFRVLCTRVRHGEGAMHRLLPELICWANSYEIECAPARWRRLSRSTTLELPERTIHPCMPDPQPLPRGRHKLPATAVTRNQCDRILYAVADISQQMGYTAMTVTDICGRSRVSRKVFYTQYVDKRAAALEAQALGFQQITAVASKAFFSLSGWPERLWRAGQEFIRFLMDYPTIAHLGFVESYAIGPAAIQRIEDSQVTFGLFLGEGAQSRTAHNSPLQLTMNAIAATVFELTFQEVRHGRASKLLRLLPDITYTCLTPFIGAQAANLFIDEKIELQSPGH